MYFIGVFFYLIVLTDSLKWPFRYTHNQRPSCTKCERLKFSNTEIIDNYIKNEVKNSEFAMPDMIDQRTIECLDFQIILDTLCNNTITILGRSLCRQKQGNNSFIIRQEYSMIDQLYNHIAMLPLRSNMNIYPVLNAIEYNLSPPEREDLYYFTIQIEQIIELYDYMILHNDKLNLFSGLTKQLLLPLELKDMFVESFDDKGNLNGEKFPVLKKLRTEIDTLRGRIIQTLKTTLQSFELRDKLADRYVYACMYQCFIFR